MSLTAIISVARLTQRTTTSTAKTPIQQLVRSLSSRKDCEESKAPKCGPTSLKSSGCIEKKKKDKGSGKKDKGYKSMWHNPECCIDPCPDMLPRYDELYWKPSDKAKRKYMQTWNECPEIKILPRKICCFEKLSFPPIKKRSKGKRPKTACPPPEPECAKGDTKCQKIKLPGCRKSREPPKCKTERGPANCKKVRTPYPSFSECEKPKLKPKRPVECQCLRLLNMCEVFESLRRQLANK